MVSSSDPGVVLVFLDTFTPLSWAIGGAALVAAAIAASAAPASSRCGRRSWASWESPAARLLAAYTGEAKTYFLPGILLNAAWAVALTVSVVVRRPLLGYAAALLDRGYSHWRGHPGLRRAAMLATGIWIALFTLRASVQGWFYAHDDVQLLAPARVGMGLPLFILGVAATLYLLEAEREDEEAEEGEHGAVTAP